MNQCFLKINRQMKEEHVGVVNVILLDMRQAKYLHIYIAQYYIYIHAWPYHYTTEYIAC